MSGAIENPRTGQRMVFIAHGAGLLEIETVDPPSSVREPEHVHPAQETGARVTSGSLRFSVDGLERTVGAGDSITIPSGTPHHVWNDGDGDIHAVQWFRPALRTRAFFETCFALARDGKLGERGMPPLLRLVGMVPEFSEEIRTTRPPWVLQRAMVTLLAPVSRRRGYRGAYASSARP